MKSQNSVRAGARLPAVPGSAGILAGETTDQHSWPARMPALNTCVGGAAAVPAALRLAPIRRCRLALMLVISLIVAFTAQAALQFDVFLGYDGIVPEASWFPVVCEIKNDGPSFVGLVELTGDNFAQGQTRRMLVELPTGTLKRIVLPVFSTSRNYTTWEMHLFDERGKLRAEQTGLRARKQIAAETRLIGALSRTAGGTPIIKPVLAQLPELQPGSARIQPSIFPDNPLVLEGMDCLYLNSEKVADLKDTQVNALLAWLNAGGHLIVGVEQISDVTASRWLRTQFPCELKEIKAVARHTELQEWVRTGSGATNQTYFFNDRRNPYVRQRPGQQRQNPAT